MNSENTSQIFQSHKPARWKRIKWTMRVFYLIAIFFLVVLAIALYTGAAPNLPNMQTKAREYETALDPGNPLVLRNHQNEKFKGFKNFLFNKLKQDSLKRAKSLPSKANSLSLIRAAFYTPWTGKTSLPDLIKNADKINTILPEWFFIDTVTFRLNTRIDSCKMNLGSTCVLYTILLV